MNIELPYLPRPFQKIIHKDPARFKVLILHRRSGKTVCALLELIKHIITSPNKNAQGAFISPTYSMAKRIAWKYLKEFTSVIPGVVYNISELTVTFPNGSTVALYSADNPDSLRGMYFDFAVLDEMSEMHPSLWDEVIRPTLIDRKGKALFTGTPKGKNRFYELYQNAEDLEDWSRYLLKWNDTKVIPVEEVMAIKREMSKSAFEQELECSFDANVKGAYYADEMKEAYVGEVPWDKSLPVITSFDLGMKDSTFCWFWQVIGAEIRAIDCMEWTSTGLPDIVKDLQSKPYNYAQHIFPFDINVRELGTGISRIEVLEKLGVKVTVAPRLGLMDGIEALRSQITRMSFDAKKCKTGIDSLSMYRAQYNEKTQVFSSSPIHDWTSHAADSARYFAITPKLSSINADKYSDWQISVNL